MDGPGYTNASMMRVPMFVPSPEMIAASQLTAFMRFCEAETRRRFPDHAAFHQFSVDEFPAFWRLFLSWSGMRHEGMAEPVCTDDACERATFFPNLRLNYAENLLRSAPFDDAAVAVTACHAAGEPEHITRGALRERVARLATAFAAQGVRPGDRIVAVVHNNAGAIVAGLAAAAVGATLSTAAPEMGPQSILSRFRQLDPVLLLGDARSPDGTPPLLPGGRLAEVAQLLPTLKRVVVLDDGPLPQGFPVPAVGLSGLLAETRAAEPAAWPRFAFSHPLFILFSSGTTGRPKCIIHGAGGTLLEHLKEHRLHGDLRPTDTLFFHTSAAWMMWNWQLSALACGARIVVYDGPITGPETLWRIVARERVTVFGTSPPYLQLCQDMGSVPARDFDLSALRAVQSTGSILYDRQFDWVWSNVGALPLLSISGGTDIIGCFVLGNPNLPIHRGECQCRSLGMDVQALRSPGSVSAGTVGELVCRTPFPSRPLGFHGDDGHRFHRAYFSQNAGVWTHGDLIEFTPDGSARMHGRSDGVLNVNGFRIGPAEIYRILQGVPEIREALAVEQSVPGAASRTRFVLLVVPERPGVLDQALAGRIRRTLAQEGSPAHVPAVIAEVPELPVTHSNKRSERAASDALNGLPSGNGEALKNPGCLDMIRRRVAEAEAEAEAILEEGGGSVEKRLRALWEALLGVTPVPPDDDFFSLGGTSLLAVRLFAEMRTRLGVDLPPATLFRAPTLAALAKVVGAGPDAPLTPLLRLRPGSGRPLFIVHGLRGDVLELRPMVTHLGGDRPVYGIQARGLDPREQPQDRVEDMAASYIDHLRREQPEGPYALVGYSFGGLVAFEMARRLCAVGERVEFLGLLDTYVHADCLRPLERGWFRLVRPLRGAWRKACVALGLATPERPFPHNTLPLLEQQGQLSWRAFAAYRPGPFDGEAVFFRATHRYTWLCDPLPVWRRVAGGGLTVHQIPCAHLDLIQEPHIAQLARLLDDSLRKADRPPSHDGMDSPDLWDLTPPAAGWSA